MTTPTENVALKIMVIDDSSTIRRSAEIFLGQAGYQTVLAEDGFDALAKMNDHNPALIFCDILMPRLDGYQTCSLIRKSVVEVETVLLPVKKPPFRTPAWNPNSRVFVKKTRPWSW